MSQKSMRVLLVFAHPDSESLSGAILQAALRGLEKAGHHVDLIDLYGEQFRAAMSAEERAAYETDTPIQCPTVRRHIDLLNEADALIVVYPTWNMGMPAILKGWFERVLLPGVAFVLDEKTHKVKGGLGHLRLIMGISTYGMFRSAMFFGNDMGRRMLGRCIRVMSPTLKCRTKWLGLYGLNTAGRAEITAFIGRVEREMARL